MEGCFVAFLPKPDVRIDDVRVEAWPGLVQLHPNEVGGRGQDELRALSGLGAR